MIPAFTNAEILGKLNFLSNSKGVHLTPCYRAFFVSLYSLFRSVGIYDEHKEMYYLHYSGSEFSNLTQFSLRTSYNALKFLSDCGLIERVRVSQSFRKVGKNEYIPNEPYFTYLNLSLLLDI